MIYRHMPSPPEPSRAWLATLSSVVVATLLLACHDPVLPTNANTSTVCWNGSVCPNWTSCPPPGYPDNGCEASVPQGPGQPISFDRGLDGGTFMDHWPTRSVPPAIGP